MSIDPKTFNQVSQFAHFGVAATIYLTLGRFISLPLLGILIVSGIALAAWKEFYYDEVYETAEVRGSSAEDFAFYMLGIAYGVAVVLAARG